MFIVIYFILFSLIGMLLSEWRIYGSKTEKGTKLEIDIVIYSLLGVVLIMLLTGKVAGFFMTLPAVWLANLAYKMAVKNFTTNVAPTLKEDWLGYRLFFKIAKNTNPSKFDVLMVIALYEAIVIIWWIFYWAIQNDTLI